jgi:hypothetical protein
MDLRRLTLCAAGALACAGPALAHHSGAMFDRAKVTTLTGVVKRYAYTQPHSWIDIVVPGEDGAMPAEWGVESGAPPAMRNAGIVPRVLKEGDKVSIRIHPLKDGRPGGSLIDITLADGKVLTLGRQNAEAGAAPPR